MKYLTKNNIYIILVIICISSSIYSISSVTQHNNKVINEISNELYEDFNKYFCEDYTGLDSIISIVEEINIIRILVHISYSN